MIPARFRTLPWSTRSRTALVLAGLLAAIGASLALALPGGRPSTTSAPSRNVQRSLSLGGARSVGRLTSGTIRFALNLRLREAELNTYLRHVNPARGGLTATQFGARFGESNAQLAQLGQVLRRLGIAGERLYPQRTAMLVRSSVAQMDRLFSLRFERYALPDGKRYFSPDGEPRIPPVLAPYVTGLADLSSRPVLPSDIPASGLTPALTAKAYDMTPLYSAGMTGQGQTIAIATPYGSVNPADLKVYAQAAGVAVPHIGLVQVDGGSTYDPRAASINSEVALDLEVILGLAPGARIIDYQGSYLTGTSQASFGHSLADIYNRIEQDGQAKVVSTSYGACEKLVGPGDQQLMDNALKALEASSVTVFVASGDTGAYACLQAAQIQPASNVSSQFTGLSVQSPASSPYAISVGGTRVELRADGSYLTESAWSDPLQRAGGGGGISASEPRPAWQQGPGVSQAAANPGGNRQVPDVSGPSDPSSGFRICQTQPGESSATCHPGQGGTSAAAPFWAASMLLVQQYAAAHGAGSLARCFAGPILYSLTTKRQPVPPFHQITLGNNGYYSAAPGWNFATGLGSPDVFNLAQDYTAFLRGRSSRSCPF